MVEELEDIRQLEDQSARNKAGIVTRRNVFSRGLTLLAAMPMAEMLGTRAFAAATDPKGSHGFYKIVNYVVPAEHWREFLAACKVNADASRKDPGILSFALLLPRDAPNTVVAVEGYRDEAASNAHQQTAHFHAFVQAAQRLGVKRSVVEADRYYP